MGLKGHRRGTSEAREVPGVAVQGAEREGGRRQAQLTRCGWDDSWDEATQEVSGGQGQRRGGGKSQGSCLRRECR